MSQRGGEVGVAGQMQRANREIAEAGHHAGRLPLRAVEASSPKVTSRTQCTRFSILQCPRSQPTSCAGLALPRARLVSAYTVTVRQRRLPGARTRRMTWIAWADRVVDNITLYWLSGTATPAEDLAELRWRIEATR
jgi:hypothetical protein